MPTVKYSNDMDKIRIADTIKSNFEILGQGTIGTIEDISGKISAVYFVETIEGLTFAIKVSPKWFNNSLCREVYCHNYLRESSIDCAFVVKYLSPRNTLVPGHEVMITNFVAGTHLVAADYLNKSILKTICSIYKILHSHATVNYGWLDVKFNGMHENWWDFVLDIDNEMEIVSYDKQFIPIITLIKKEIRSFIPQLQIKPCLLYGDFNPNNFVKTSSGIIPFDLQSCFSGHYLYDYAIALTYEPKVFYRLNEVCEEYQDSDSDLILLYAMRHILCLIAHNISRGDHKNIQSKVKKLKVLLDLYNSNAKNATSD